MHLFVEVEEPHHTHLIISYLLNGGFSLAILLLIYIFQNRFKDRLGFVFMAASLAKFAILLLLFRRVILGDVEDFSKATFLIVFIPYALSLVTTTYAMTKIIENADKHDN